MSADLVWKNLAAYCLQIGLLVGLAAFVPGVLRLRMPRVKLAYLQILLLACLVLPLAQKWQPQLIPSSIEISSVLTGLAPPGAPAPRRIPASTIALGLLAMGAVARLVWLAAGFWRLWLHRRRSHAFGVTLPWKTRAEIRLSRDVAGPVTFGLRRPVVLVPAQFPEMEERTQRVILCHELRHVERRDWLFTVGEELVRAAFWFHPAIWWLLGEIQLAREQAVDREVIDLTQEREEYVDALLAIAGARAQPDLAPAPLFLRRRHLKQRVVSIFNDGRMSRMRAVSALAAGLGILVGASWFVTLTFPLFAAPQVVEFSPAAPANGIAESAAPAQRVETARAAEKQPRRVAAARDRARPPLVQTIKPPVTTAPLDGARSELLSQLPVQEGQRIVPDVPETTATQAEQPQRIKVGGNIQQARLIRQPKPIYPPEAKAARIQGVVKLSVVIGKDGAVHQIELLSGHPLLTQSAIDAVRQWEYEPTFLNGDPVEVMTQIDVNYTLSW